MSASDALPGQMLEPLSSTDGYGHFHLNAQYHEQPSGLPDSTAEHPLLHGGPEPGSVEAGGSPDLTAPVA